MPSSRFAHPLRASYSVLLVDDEGSMRDVMKSFLLVYGHEVVEAGGGKEAKRHLARRAFDVVITDLWMPDGSGVDLISHVRRELPSVSVVAVTGRPATLLPPELTSGERRLDAILEKPFPLGTLVEAVAVAGERARLISGLARAAG